MLNFILFNGFALLMGYLIGSVSFARVITKIVSPETNLERTDAPLEGTDEKLEMSGISATSVRLKLGPKYGILVSLLDMLKMVVPVAALQYFFPDSPALFFAAAGGVVGHNWPVYYKFQGGYGHSPIYGALLVIDWTAVPISFVGTAVFYFIFRQVQIASFLGVLLILPWLWYHGLGRFALLYAVVFSLSYLIRILPDFLATRQIEKRKTNPQITTTNIE
jgi:glycerol-3-phosphate acyltransferase PlsY